VPPALRTLLLASVAIAASAGVAGAYPEFQLSKGAARCSLCHFSPTGGGLINNYGRSQAEDEISMFGGNPDFLYGIWEQPDWIKLGADLRLAFLTRDNGADPDFLAFPMQGDTYANFFFGDFTVATIVGPRAQARTPRQGFGPRMNSREHWVMWRPKSTGPYVRAGRFYAPFGLRQQDHTAFNRRYLGFHSFEETYNLSGGWVKNDWEGHATLFMPPPGPLYELWGGGPRQTGAAGYFERRILDDTGAVGGQVKLAQSPIDQRYIAGGVAKYFLESAQILLMGELDLGLQVFDADGSPSRAQLTAYASASYFPVQGILVGASVQRHDPDLSVAATGYDALQLSLQCFVESHFEIHTFARAELSGDYDKMNGLAFLMLHYWL
jgi:hypothetical protein